MKTMQGTAIKGAKGVENGIKKHPFIALAALAGAGILIWYVFFRNSSTNPSNTTTQAPSQQVQPSLTSNPSVTPTLSNPQAASSSVSPSTYQAPSLASGALSSGVNTGYINYAPYNYEYAPSTSTTTSNSYVKNVSNNVQNTITKTYNNQKTYSQQLNYQRSTSLSTSGAFSGLNYGSSVSSGLNAGTGGISGIGLMGSVIGSGFSNIIKSAEGFFSGGKPSSSAPTVKSRYVNAPHTTTTTVPNSQLNPTSTSTTTTTTTKKPKPQGLFNSISGDLGDLGADLGQIPIFL